ncbi:hypothetical protein AGMMS50256_08420 [Betaproteobacteria bacterium]|nr:hypothetical protein AGMMS50256_08420 [Betaproteobacteria bacterium]
MVGGETSSIGHRSENRSLFDCAAKAKGKTFTDFVLDTARVAAEDDLLNQKIISVSPEAYSAFQERLDMPFHANEHLCCKENK